LGSAPEGHRPVIRNHAEVIVITPNGSDHCD